LKRKDFIKTKTKYSVSWRRGRYRFFERDGTLFFFLIFFVIWI